MNDGGVSVVIPARDEAPRIGRAIEDALAQTVRPREIIVVDDGSSDGTGAVAAAYPLVRVLTPERPGISAARNRGFVAARGEWIALLDADDRWRPERLAELLRASAAAPDAGFAFSDYVVSEVGRENAASNLARTAQYGPLPRVEVASGVARIAREPLGRALAVGNFLGTSTISVRASLIAGARFDESLPERTATYQLSEDVEWYLRVLRETDALVIERVLASYERRPGSAAAAHGRVRSGDAVLGERIARAPERYVAGAAEAFAAQRREHQRHAALLHLRAAECGAAKRILAGAQRERFDARDALLAGIAAAGDNPAGQMLLRGLRATWRMRLRPTR